MVLAAPNAIRSEGILPSELPVVDLSLERAEVAKLIVKACEEYGFFKVINHGISNEVIAKTEEAGFGFFRKPMLEKKVAAPAYGWKNIGVNGDMGEVEYLLLSATTDSIAHISKTISTDPFNLRYLSIYLCIYMHHLTTLYLLHASFSINYTPHAPKPPPFFIALDRSYTHFAHFCYLKYYAYLPFTGKVHKIYKLHAIHEVIRTVIALVLDY